MVRSFYKRTGLAIALIVGAIVLTAGRIEANEIVQESSSFDYFRTLTMAPPHAHRRPGIRYRRNAKPRRGHSAARPNHATIVPPAAGFARVMVLAPQAAARADVTHAALVLTRQHFHGNFSFEGRLQTVRQLRTGSAPNPWECGWIVWDYQDTEHFYYVAIKPNGWEFGKRDPGYAGGQRFLASGNNEFAIGAWHRFSVQQQDDRITIDLDGARIVSYADDERPYRSGALGFYAEDAEIEIADVMAPFVANFSGYAPQFVRADGHVLRDWIAPFLGYGFIAIADRKQP